MDERRCTAGGVMHAVRSGHVEARSRPLHKGRTTIVVETDLHDAGGRHVGRVTQTQAILSRS